MVSIEPNNRILDSIKDNELLYTFYLFVNNRPLPQLNISNLNTTENIVLHSIKAISQNNESAFLLALRALSKRNPTGSSPWINDNVLIFVILLGCKIFNKNNSLITNILNLRSKSEVPEKNLVTVAYKNILSNNSDYLGKMGFLHWVFDYILSKRIPDTNQIKKIYFELKANFQLLQKDVLLKIVSERAYDLWVEYFPFDSERIQKMENFISNFESRSKKISTALYTLVLLAFIIITIIFTVKIFDSSEENQKIISYYNIIKNLIGYGGLLTIILSRGKIIEFFNNLIYKVFKYSK